MIEKSVLVASAAILRDVKRSFRSVLRPQKSVIRCNTSDGRLLRLAFVVELSRNMPDISNFGQAAYQAGVEVAHAGYATLVRLTKLVHPCFLAE